ncbi:MAG: cupin domain-containing protein [Salinivirgaceae bacterium]|jgi:mannose-6-phosphate isomerase-like protein (cupin superfamily)|nr:cupin domain-containing protein [Bacteroidales bacterium]
MKKSTLFLISVAIFIASCGNPKTETIEVDINELTEQIELVDYGAEPIVFDIEDVTSRNVNFRTAFWTGNFIQMTLMTLQPGEDIGLELHTQTDQFIRVEEGKGIVYMGDTEDNLDFEREVKDDFALFIPAGKWHNLKNTGDKPLKLYSIYAPAEHARGTVHQTRAEGIEHDHDHDHDH